MPDRLFEWVDEGRSIRMWTTFWEADAAWHAAFKQCGWKNRTSLKLIEPKRGMTIQNWWEAMADRSLYKFNTLYFSGSLNDRLKSGFIQLTET